MEGPITARWGVKNRTMAWEDHVNGAEPFELGEFRVDPKRRAITGPAGEISIEPKIMAVLLMLSARPGEVITRQEFIDSIWATEFSGDESLTRAVSQLRKILDDGRGKNTYIVTVPKTGYRLTSKQDSASPGGTKRRRLGAGAFLVALLAVLIAAWVYYEFQHTADDTLVPPADKARVMLAVLPFDIQGGTAEDEPLAFGVADEILSALSRNPSIAVIAGNSSFQFQGDRKKDLATLGQQLNVNYVIDGSLRRSPRGLRVGVHLIDTGSGLVEWSDVVTRPEDEIYTIPDEVAAAVQAALGKEPVARFPRRAAPDPAAYEAYLYAKFLLRLPFGENLAIAMDQLERAVALDPGLSEAWATLAITRVRLFSEGPDRPAPGAAVWSEQLQAAQREAENALAVDPESVEAALALILIDYRKQTDSLVETDSRLQSLLAKAPDHPKLNFRTGTFMGAVGRFDEAVHYLGRALALDPLAVLNTALYADSLVCSGRTDEALAIGKALGGDESFQRTYTGLIMNLLAGNFPAARGGFTNLGPNDVFIAQGVVTVPSLKVDSLNTQRLSRLVVRVIDVAEGGDASTDPTLASDLIKAANEGLITHFYVAQLLAASGLVDEGLDLAMQRLAEGDTLVRESGILLRPAFQQARQDPRIFALFEETGQLDYWLQTDSWPDFCNDPDLPYNCREAAWDVSATIDRP